MMRHETQAWCGVTLIEMNRIQKHVPETIRNCLCCIILLRIIPFYQWISRIIFKICFSKSCLPSWATKQTYFGKFTYHRHTLVDQNCQASVRLHHCEIWWKEVKNGRKGGKSTSKSKSIEYFQKYKKEDQQLLTEEDNSEKKTRENTLPEKGL